MPNFYPRICNIRQTGAWMPGSGLLYAFGRSKNNARVIGDVHALLYTTNWNWPQKELFFYQRCIDVQSTNDRWNDYAKPTKPVNRTNFPAKNQRTYPKDEQQNRIEHAVYCSNPKAFV